ESRKGLRGGRASRRSYDDRNLKLVDPAVAFGSGIDRDAGRHGNSTSGDGEAGISGTARNENRSWRPNETCIAANQPNSYAIRWGGGLKSNRAGKRRATDDTFLAQLDSIKDRKDTQRALLPAFAISGTEDSDNSIRRNWTGGNRKEGRVGF